MSELTGHPRHPAEMPRLLRAYEILGVACFAVLLTATLLGALARYFEVGGFEWSFEISGVSFLWVIFSRDGCR